MKVYKVIFFLLLLTPMVGYGQEYMANIGNFHFVKGLGTQINGLSQRVYELTLTNNLPVFKNNKLSDTFTKVELSNLEHAIEMYEELQDPLFPDDPFARIDTVYYYEFDIEQITRLGYVKENNILKAIAPLRFLRGKLCMPLIYVDWEMLKKLLSSRDVEIIEAMFKANSKTLNINSGEDSIYYVDDRYESIVNEFTQSFRKLYAHSLDTLNPLIFEDSLFVVPFDYSGIIHLDSINFNFGRQFRDKNNNGVPDITDTIYELDVILQPKHIVLATIMRYIEKDPEFPDDEYAYFWWTSTRSFYCRKEDYMPLLPKWIQLLIHQEEKE